MREKSVRTDLLLDFYGNLLTPKMRRTCESYYNDDLTLAEIAEAEGISRQGVHDTVKRAESSLKSMRRSWDFSRFSRNNRQEQSRHWHISTAEIPQRLPKSLKN